MSSATTTETPETELTPELIERVMRLSPESQARLRELLGEGPPVPELEPVGDWAYWKAEIKRRIDAVENGTMKTYSLQETMEYLRQVAAEGESK
ncbi:unnamed protein product [Gemmataceae bacterium]|nr:unnamed protein product [Gemmataceae bacterium]VTU02046.1 unnamed protein product [Gemmataceae bacterium]